MSGAIDIHSSEAELTRTGLELRQLSRAWQPKSNGDRFAHALLSFLGSKANVGTRRLYSAAIVEFFGWYHVHRGRIPLPNEVLRAEAFLYVQYLQDRVTGLEEYRLEHDSERKLDLAIYRAIKTSPGRHISDIRKRLLNEHQFSVEVNFLARGIRQYMRVLEIEETEPRGDDLDAYVAVHGRVPVNALDMRLACLCEHNLIRRTPTVAQIREQVVAIAETDPTQAQIQYRVDPELFSYFLNTYTNAVGVERAATVVSKLNGLASFWSFLIKQSSENLPGASDQLLQHNVWHEPRKELGKKAIQRGRAMRELRTPNRELLLAVLATTFAASHGERAHDAASAAMEGVDVEASATGKPTLLDLRDRAVLLCVFWTGLRSEEMANARRSDLDMRTGLITIVGKGSATRSFVVPQPARLAILKFHAALTQWSEKAAPGVLVHSLIMPRAPLLPPLKLWGHAAQENIDPQHLAGIGSSTFAQMLRHRAEMAKISRQSPEWYKLHPHGLRHLAALEANRRGVDVATIQATLGHASLATTSIYLEVRDPLDRSLMPKAAAAAPRMPVPAALVDEPSVPLRHSQTKDVVLDLEQVEQVEPEQLVEPVAVYPAEYLEPTEQALQLAEESKAVGFLLDKYKHQWGEKKHRTKIVADSKTSGATGLLAHAYVGKKSGLPWWDGATGDMSDPRFSYTPNTGFPSMPIISPSQFLGDGSAGCAQPLCRALSRLYDNWLDEPGRGPTAAGALTQWLHVASRLTDAVDERIRLVNGSWVEFDHALDETSTDGTPKMLREHLDDAIVAWFKAAAWQYRPSTGSLLMARGDQLKIPDWYGDSDPLAELPAQERTELLDWLLVMVGDPPRDTLPRYDGKSRAALGKVLLAMCTYESLATDKTLKDDRMRSDYLAAAETAIQKQVASLTSGQNRSFSYRDTKSSRRMAQVRAETLAARAKSKEGDKETAKKQAEAARVDYHKRLGPHFMDVLGELAGDDVKSDPILSLFARCTSGIPLDSGARAQLQKYKDLFRVVGKTISHTPAFAIEYAKATGQHSECVARRLARHIYEEGKGAKWDKRANWSDTTLPYLEAMSAYRIPCPASQEKELMNALATRQTHPVFEEWKKAQHSILVSSEPEQEASDLEEVFESEQERGDEEAIRGYQKWEAQGSQAKPNAKRSRSQSLVQAARKFAPNAIDFFPVIFGMRRRT